MRPGDTFLADLGLGNHLHVVLSRSFENDSRIIVAMISTWDEDHKDDSCILRPEDGHSFIKHFSYVAYATARIIRTADIERIMKKQKSFSESVFRRVLNGADTSQDFPQNLWLIMDHQELFPH
jgi:hypothetical protein